MLSNDRKQEDAKPRLSHQDADTTKDNEEDSTKDSRDYFKFVRIKQQRRQENKESSNWAGLLLLRKKGGSENYK